MDLEKSWSIIKWWIFKETRLRKLGLSLLCLSQMVIRRNWKIRPFTLWKISLSLKITRDKKWICKSPMMVRLFLVKYLLNAWCNWIRWWLIFITLCFLLCRVRIGANVNKKLKTSFWLLCPSLRVKFPIPSNLWLLVKNSSNWMQTTMPVWTSKDKIWKNYIISKENSANGSKSFLTYWMMTVKLRKNQLMPDPKWNWITGESECKKSPIGVNSWKTKISKLSKISFSDNNNMILTKEVMEKKFPNWLWTTIVWIYCWLTNWTKPKIMSNIWLL